ncbi:hypothetical protein [Neolewinella persica]|uniref:hypothetical protein n=1 Tax=Neolewinella persica TaxID=70998 RepID=UPI0003A67DD9|nr:hypothetical protein [Neolewinella persica]
MKTSFSGFNSSLLFLVLLLSTAFVVACDQENNIIPVEDLPLSDEQAAQIVEASLVGEQQGLDAAIADITEVAVATTSCGTAIDSTYVFARNTDRLTANYAVDLQWLPSCGPGGLVRDIVFSRTTDGTYSTDRISSDDESAGNLTVDNITGGVNLNVSGSFSRTGTQKLMARQQRTVNSNCGITLENLKVNKGTKRIESGQAIFLLTGSSSGGRSFSVEGSIIFHGAGSATVIINGNQYEVNR